ncbi:class F sortase [Williamsia soli]|uniref:class F sortase n=1 Tax=Williamsia soli TaxID=364929 RepID=UPI001F268400|nr:class F sortase [Williamsia soli]
MHSLGALMRTSATAPRKYGLRPAGRVAALVVAILAVLTFAVSGCANDVASDVGEVPISELAVDPAVSNAGLTKSVPSRIEIPSIDVDSPLMDLGLDADGALQVPKAGFPAGWYTGAPTPGEQGPSVIAGHVDWAGAPGVFYELRNLKPGAEIAVTRQDGSIAKFEVTEVTAFPKDEFPTDLVYGTLDYAGLRLVTCGGAFDENADSYDDNIVAFAKLVGTG